MKLDLGIASRRSDERWEHHIIPTLMDYIRIPCVSQDFDPGWKQSGHIERAATLLLSWCEQQLRAYFTSNQTRCERYWLLDRTPVLLIEIPAFNNSGPPPQGTILLYGHLDKQPPAEGWREGLSAWEPVLDGTRLYGRGSADDGYAVFAAVSAIRLLEEQGIPHARCVILIEAGEESGSPDLPAYVEHLAERIGQPDLVICLDSGCGDYERLWLTTSLRGVVMGSLKVRILTEGVHSGSATGIVPSTFAILRCLLDRVENAHTGSILLHDLHAPRVPEVRKTQAREAAAVLGSSLYSGFPWVEGAHTTETFLAGIILQNTWKPGLSVTGVGGMPPMEAAGNVRRPFTEVMLSMRIPPTVSAAKAADALKHIFETNPPNGAQVSFTPALSADGWDSPELEPWLSASVNAASSETFGKPAMGHGEGGSIPFMTMLATRFPRAQFVITGVLGPQSNAHGPNEFLHIPTAKRVTVCVANIVADHGQHQFERRAEMGELF